MEFRWGAGTRMAHGIAAAAWALSAATAWSAPLGESDATSGPEAEPAIQAPVVIAVPLAATPESFSDPVETLQETLMETLQRKVKLHPPAPLAQVIRALRAGEVQVAFLDAWPALLAHEQAGAEVVFSEVREVALEEGRGEAGSCLSYWVVPRESRIARMEELRNTRVAFPDAASLAGYVAPVSRLAELGLLRPRQGRVEPRRFLGKVLFSGSYADSWNAVQAKRADAMIISGDAPKALYEEIMAACRVLERQGPTPWHTVVLAPGLNDPLRRALIGALSELNEPRYRSLMRALISDAFVRFEPATTAQVLDSLAQMVARTGLEWPERLAPEDVSP